jgi:serine/threonine protein kinase
MLTLEKHAFNGLFEDERDQVDAPLPEIDGFTEIQRIGQGGMGEVFRARKDGHWLALKLMSAEKTRWVERRRFAAEFEMMSKISHSSVVKVYEMGEYEGRPFYTMEWIEGLDILTTAQLYPDRVEELFGELFEALDHIHSQGIVHRDIKPENVIVLDDGSLRLIDFGLARDKNSARMTMSGTVMGTPAYMSPEQVQANKVDRRTDLYSAGVILYEAIAGHPPYDAPDVYSLMFKIVSSQPIPIGKRDSRECFASWLMEKKPEDRPLSARVALNMWQNPPPPGTCARRKASRWLKFNGLRLGLLGSGLLSWAAYMLS